MKLSRGNGIALFIVLLLLADQILKIWIKTNMVLGESIHVFDWFRIYFIENNGMAFGVQLGGKLGKLLLSLLRIGLIVIIVIFLKKLITNKVSTGLLIGTSLILVGAVGNMLDCTFYGLIFSDSTFSETAVMFPSGGGYAPLLFGKVVDMFYFPLIDTTLPEWLPIWGGRHFIFFRPIFNIADSCITVGFLYMILFKYSELSKELNFSKNRQAAA